MLNFSVVEINSLGSSELSGAFHIWQQPGLHLHVLPTYSGEAGGAATGPQGLTIGNSLAAGKEGMVTWERREDVARHVHYSR